VLVLAAGVVALASVVFATMAAYRRVQQRGLRGGSAVAMTTLAGLVVFLGGWIVFDVYVVIREVTRRFRHPARSTRSPGW
jgi:hypothetical protein